MKQKSRYSAGSTRRKIVRDDKKKDVIKRKLIKQFPEVTENELNFIVNEIFMFLSCN